MGFKFEPDVEMNEDVITNMPDEDLLKLLAEIKIRSTGQKGQTKAIFDFGRWMKTYRTVMRK